MKSRRLAGSVLAGSALAGSALFLLTGCTNPTATYRSAAKELKFTLDQVEPSLLLAYPLDQSRLRLRLTLGAENPTAVRFKARSITGRITLDADGASYAIGQVNAKGVDLKPAARTPVVVDLAFSYGDLGKSWVALRNVGGGQRPGTWHLNGEVGLEVLGLPLTVPLRVEKHVSGS